MDTLTPDHADQLMKARDNYAEITCRTDAECTVVQLLSIINNLEMSINLNPPDVNQGCMVVVRGYYRSEPTKLKHVLQFAVISSDISDAKVKQNLLDRFGSSILQGFDIVSFDVFPAREKLFLCGTGLED